MFPEIKSKEWETSATRRRLTGSVPLVPTGLGFSLDPIFTGPRAASRGAPALERGPCLEPGSAYVRFRPWRDELPVEAGI